LGYARNLQFEENPDYSYIRSLLEGVFNRYNFSYDFNFDWISIKNKKLVFPEDKTLIKAQNSPK
jgi:uncharacterized ubiquitin-like protein YukD